MVEKVEEGGDCVGAGTERKGGAVGGAEGGAEGCAEGGAVDLGEGLLGAAVGCGAGEAAGWLGDAGSRTPGLSGWFTTSADPRPAPVVTSA